MRHFILLLMLLSWKVFAADPTLLLKEGDLIFQKSQSAQSSAIVEATGSEWSHVGIVIKNQEQWSVAEAIQPVTITPLLTWIQRGKNQEFKVFRYPELKDSMIPALYTLLKKNLGTNYDIYFEWNDERLYCSEFVHKVFRELTGSGVGQIQKMKDLNLEGPAVKELIRIRLTDLGKTLNLEEPVLTPIRQMRDSRLQEILISQ